jgi:hypothetical protein
LSALPQSAIIYSCHRGGQTYQTPLLPGFALVLAELLAVADRWR